MCIWIKEELCACVSYMLLHVYILHVIFFKLIHMHVLFTYTLNTKELYTVNVLNGIWRVRNLAKNSFTTRKRAYEIVYS